MALLMNPNRSMQGLGKRLSKFINIDGRVIEADLG